MIALLMMVAAPSGCATAQTQMAMNACTAAEAQRADAALNRQWSASYAAMKRRDAQDHARGGGPGYAAALLSAQRAWLVYRDRQCVVDGLQASGGSVQSLLIAQCRAAMTRDRTGALAVLTKGL